MIQEKGDIFSIYEGEDNPLNHAFFVSVNDSERIEMITNEILQLEMVEDAMYGGESITDLISLLNTIRFGIMVFMLLLSMLAIFLISNTIKMAIYSRNNEIMIMRNVGATNLFIKIPFMIEGMIIGLIGAIIPCILTFFGYRYLYQMMDGQLFTNVFALQPISRERSSRTERPITGLRCCLMTIRWRMQRVILLTPCVPSTCT